MQISRLDKIVENNVTYSTQKASTEQMIFILQDISTTLAMIYDSMCGMAPVSEGSASVLSMAVVIPFDEMKNYKKMHFDSIDYDDGYEVTFLRYEYTGNEVDSVVLKAFGEEMKLPKNAFGRRWRCWNIKPTKAEREKEKWAKK